jgi:hypothetical protein
VGLCEVVRIVACAIVVIIELLCIHAFAKHVLARSYQRLELLPSLENLLVQRSKLW